MIGQQYRRGVLEKVTPKQNSTHPGLWLDRYMPTVEEQQQKKQLVDAVTRLSAAGDADPYKAFFNRWKKALDDAGAHTRTGTVRTRMVLGLGSEGVLETSIALHRTYGVPYIPGSALKGLLAAYMRKYYASAKEYAALATFLFGTTKGAGYLTLYDALYVPGTGFKIDGKPVPLHADVMTVHHAKYYGNEGEPPADSDSPVPVPFLTATGQYCLAMGMPGVAAGEQEQARHWIDFAFEVLAKALDEWGVGAKTSSGYGRLSVAGGERGTAKQELSTAVQKTAVDIADQQQADALINKINALADKDVGNRIGIYGQEWLEKPLSPEQKLRVAKALLDRVHNVKQERIVNRSTWYKRAQELVQGAK